MVGADGAHRRRIFRRVLEHGDDVVDRGGVDDDLGMRDHIAEPVGDFGIGHVLTCLERVSEGVILG